MLEIYNGRDKFYQWDVNQKLIVDDNIIAVQYDNGTGDALVCGVYEYEGQHVADVPNIMLQTYWAIKCYAYCGECVRAEKVYEVEKRSRPDDYIYTETETLRYTTLFDMLTDLEAKHNEEVAAINTAVNKNKSDIYKIGNDVEAIRDVNLPNVYNHLNTLLDSTNKNKTSINELNNTTANLEKKVSNNTTYIELLQDSNNTIANFVNNELDTIDGKIENHENRITTLENRPTGGGGSGTASDVDWNENDETSPAYIKNRTHYEAYEKKEIMPATAADMVSPEEAMAIYINPVELDVDKEYTITYNGVEYKSKCVSGEELMGQPDVLLLGNYGLMTGGTDTGEPFVIMTIPAEYAAQSGFAMAVYMLDGATELTLSISFEGNVIHKLDDKYINFKKPNWDAKNGEEGYIANRTHYIERYGQYELNLSNVDGLDCFEVESGVMAYKVSEDILPYPAKEQANLFFYTSDNVGYQLTATDARADDGYVYAKDNNGGFYSISQVAWASSDLGLNIPSTGTYIFIKKSKCVRAALTANEIVFKLDTRYLDLSNYYTKWETNQKLIPYPTNLGNRSLKDISDTGKLDISGYKDIQVDLSLQGTPIADTIKVKMYDSNNNYICDMVIAENLGISDIISIQAYYRASGLLNIDVEVGNSAILRDMKRFIWRKTTSVSTLGTIQIYTVNGTVFGENTALSITGVKA